MGMNMMEMCSMMMDRANEEMSGQCLSMMLKGKHRESLVKALRSDKELLSSLRGLINEAKKKK